MIKPVGGTARRAVDVVVRPPRIVGVALVGHGSTSMWPMEENGAGAVWFLMVDDALGDLVPVRVEPMKEGGRRGDGEDDDTAHKGWPRNARRTTQRGMSISVLTPMGSLRRRYKMSYLYWDSLISPPRARELELNTLPAGAMRRPRLSSITSRRRLAQRGNAMPTLVLENDEAQCDAPCHNTNVFAPGAYKVKCDACHGHRGRTAHLAYM